MSISTTQPGLTAAAALYRNATSSMLQHQHPNSLSQYTSTANDGHLSTAAVLAAASLNVRDAGHHQSLFPVPPPIFAPLYLNKEVGNAAPQTIGTPSSPFSIDSLRSIAVSSNEQPKPLSNHQSSNLPEPSIPFHNLSNSSSTGKESSPKQDLIRRSVDASDLKISKSSVYENGMIKRSFECSCDRNSDEERYFKYS